MGFDFICMEFTLNVVHVITFSCMQLFLPSAPLQIAWSQVWEVPGSHAQNKPMKLVWASGLAAVALRLCFSLKTIWLVSFSEALGSMESDSATGASLDPKG